MRVSGAVPDRLEGGDDSSENSSESSIYDVMDTQGEMVHMARKLTCRVRLIHYYCLSGPGGLLSSPAIVLLSKALTPLTAQRAP